MNKSLQAMENKLLITGPCSAESEKQLKQTAGELQALGVVDIFRAGIWKPRTQPGMFEGMGEKALPWLRAIKQEYNIPVATEVANAKQTDACLKFDIDYLWLGARTVTNPFSVQEVVDALQGTSHPIWIKNPVCADLHLWIGAIERCLKAGLTDIHLIHRGFKTSYSTCLRNEPLWEIAQQIQQSYPQFKLILDPSHISGDAKLIEALMKQSLDFQYDGYMIESHINPAVAITDAAQQLTPLQLNHLLKRISENSQAEQQNDFPLQSLRRAIDELDVTMLNLLLHRLQLAQSIGKWKNEHDQPVYQPSRWQLVKDKLKADAGDIGINSVFMDAFLSLLHQESIRLQTNDVYAKNAKLVM